MAIEWCVYSSESIKNWSGGTTQELYISPKSATVSGRNFDFRISTATVEVEESTFTNFDGYLRKLMVLEGRLTITHENHHSIELQPFDQDAFSGDWNTNSKGEVRDFNVIYRPHLKPRIEVKHLDNEKVELISKNDLFLYVYVGNCTINHQLVDAGIGLFSSDSVGLMVEVEQQCTLILVRFD